MRFLALAFAVVFMAGTVEAGIVVTKKGNVFIGKIRKDDIKKDVITMIRPRRKNGEKLELGKRATFDFERHLLRWFDHESDTLESKYWDLHRDKKIEFGWVPSPNTKKVPKEGIGVDENTGLALDTLKMLKNRPQLLTNRKIQRAGCEFNPPLDWERQDRGENISVMIASNEEVAGYAARIHVFSVKRPPQRVVAIDTQVKWYEKAIRLFSKDSKINRLHPDKEVLLRSDSRNIEMTTLSQRDYLDVLVRRYIFVRSDRIYFISCYAHKDEFKRRSQLFEDFRKKLSILED
jgi:hypothetical protein